MSRGCALPEIVVGWNALSLVAMILIRLNVRFASNTKPLTMSWLVDSLISSSLPWNRFVLFDMASSIVKNDSELWIVEPGKTIETDSTGGGGEGGGGKGGGGIGIASFEALGDGGDGEGGGGEGGGIGVASFGALTGGGDDGGGGGLGGGEGG